MRRISVIFPLLALGIALFVPACSHDIHGVEVSNRTDRIVRVELLQLKPDGEMKVYSTQTLAPGGEFKNKVDSEERRPGMRIRFTLADARPDDPNRVLLNLPDTKNRAYDLILAGDRLSARDMTRSEKRNKPAE